MHYFLFRHGVKSFPQRRCLGWRSNSLGPYKWMTYDDMDRRIQNFGSGLVNLGLKKQSKVGIFSENRPKWVICEQACNAFSFISVPIHDSGSEFIRIVLSQSKLEIIVCSRPKTIRLLKFMEQLKSNFSLRCIIQMESIKYEEYALASEINIKIIPFEFIEQDGSKKISISFFFLMI